MSDNNNELNNNALNGLLAIFLVNFVLIFTVLYTISMWAIDIYCFKYLWAWIITKQFNIAVPSTCLIVSIIIMLLYVRGSFVNFAPLAKQSGADVWSNFFITIISKAVLMLAGYIVSFYL